MLYARVSSERQAEKDISIPSQLKALREHALKRGWEIYGELIDEAQSARTTDRPAFKKMISLARQKEKPFDAILVWKFSRFARSRFDSAVNKALLKRQGISVISMNEDFGDGAVAKLMEGIIESVDEFTSDCTAEDTLRGLKEAARRGFHCGGTIPIGYRGKKVMDGHNQRTKLEPDDTYAPIIRRIFQMCIDGLGAKEIAKTLNAEGLRTRSGDTWGKHRILYILRNEVYAGTKVFNKRDKRGGRSLLKDQKEVVRVQNCQPALVDDQMFRRAQKMIEERSPEYVHPRTVGSKYVLSGLLRCERCGGTMCGCAAKTSKYFYYECRNSARRGKGTCKAKAIPKKKMEEFVIDRIRRNILTEENLMRLVELTNEEECKVREEDSNRLRTVEKQRKDLRERLRKHHIALETEELDLEHLAPRIKELTKQIAELDKRHLELDRHIRESRPEPLDPKVVRAYADDLNGLLAKGTIAEQRSFLRTFIKRIDVNHPKVVIDYTIPVQVGKALSANISETLR